ncbi:MAG: hypothetical protein LC742_00720 [Acidobacteria bacterium]|nr:hypothetical protein [Acidobacteriota bacterium]
MKNSASRLFANSQAISLTIFGFCLCLMLVPLSFTSRPATAKTEDKDATTSPTRTATRALSLIQESADPHILAAAYYRIGDNLRTTLMLNNKSPQPAEARVTVFSMDGQLLDLAPVTVGGNSFSEIDLREQIGANEAFRQGSLQVLYHGQDMMMGSQVKIVDEAHSLVFDEQLVEPAAMFASSRLEGVWWLPSPRSDVRLALSNTTGSALAVTTRVDGIAPPQREPLTLTLAPHETRLLELPRDINGHQGGALSRAGSISLAHTGTPGALLARAFIAQPATGFSSSVQFIDPGKSRSATLHGAGLRLGTVGGDRLTPVVVARNTGDAETIITGRIPYTTGDDQTSVLTLPQFRLSAGETKQLPLADALRRGHIPQNLKSAGLEFEYTGAPGSVVMSAQSVGGNGNQVFRVPLLDPMAQKSSTGGYPWFIEGDSSTVVYVKNVTGQAQQYVLQLNYPGGAYTLGEQMLAAGQTAAHDLRALRDEQTPDLWSRRIPLDATGGQVQWSMRGGENLVLIGRAEQADTAHAMSSSYACQSCCPDTFYSGSCAPDFITGFPGETTQLVATQSDITCYGAITEPYTVNAFNWSSSNTAVATVAGGQATAQGPGEAYLTARWLTQTWQGGGHSGCFSNLFEATASAFCDVLEQRSHRGRIQAQGTNPPVEKSRAWSQDYPPTKADGLFMLDEVWNELTPRQKADRQRAYEDATSYIQNSPSEGRPPDSRSFKDPNRRDPDARIDVVIITGSAFGDILVRARPSGSVARSGRLAGE